MDFFTSHQVKHWMAVLAGSGNRHPSALIGCVPDRLQGHPAAGQSEHLSQQGGAPSPGQCWASPPVIPVILVIPDPADGLYATRSILHRPHRKRKGEKQTKKNCACTGQGLARGPRQLCTEYQGEGLKKELGTGWKKGTEQVRHTSPRAQPSSGQVCTCQALPAQRPPRAILVHLIRRVDPVHTDLPLLWTAHLSFDRPSFFPSLTSCCPSFSSSKHC